MFSRKKIPVYSAGKSIESVQKEYKLKKIIKLASNENPYKIPKKVKKTLKTCIQLIHLYPDSSYYQLRKKIAEKLNILPENIITGNGSDEILDLVFKGFVKPGDKVIIPNPSFALYKILSAIYKTKVLKLNLKNFHYNISSLLSKISPDTKLIILCNPNNPTGTYISSSDMETIIRKLPPKSILVVDEAYYHYVTATDFPDMLSFIKKYKNKKIIITRTFSKIFGLAGLRIGYGIAQKGIISFLDKIRMPFNVNRLAVYAAIKALECNEFINKCYLLNKKNKEYLYTELEKLGLEYIESQTNFVMIKLPVDGEYVNQKLLQQGIIIRPLSEYRLRNYIRVTIGTRKELKKFLKELKKILK